MNHADVIVIGAGFGGLSAAALLAQRGRKVQVFESALELGGCASKFDRHGYRFAAGATIGMGFEKGGLFSDLYAELRIPLPHIQDLPIIMDVHLPDRTLRYWKEKKAWYQELAHHFPHDHERMCAFYEEVFAVAAAMQSFIAAKPIFPPQTLSDYRQLLKLARPQLIRLFPYVFDTIHTRLKRYGLADHREFVCFLNGQLMDSVQTTVDQSPALLGYIALNVFHQGAYYVYGGLATIAEQLADVLKGYGGEIMMRTPIVHIREITSGWEVTTAKKQTYTANQLIVANSLHNLSSLMGPTHSEAIPKKLRNEKNKPAWGAFTMYFGVKDEFLPEESPTPLFHQFIQHMDESPTEANQFLFSISASDDRLRSAAGHRAITISSHTQAHMWWERDRYETMKQEYASRIVTAIQQRFPLFQQAIEVELSGTPVTFHRYTQRHLGKVGGYIPEGPASLFTAYSPRLSKQGLWACGDTVFPGAGTLGTAMSGWIVANEMCRT